MNKYKIIFCGSHFSPAYAVIEEMNKNEKFDIYYIGRFNSMEGDSSISLESIYMKRLKLHYNSITNARLQRSITYWTLLSVFKLPRVAFQCFQLIHKIKPDLVVSFGGFIALPICLLAWIMKIPVITHEQTAILGLANRIIGRFARIICLSYKNTKYVPKGAVISITGNSIRRSILNPPNSSKFNFGNPKLPLICVTGGSQGSESINTLIAKILPLLVSNYRVIHLCGFADSERDFHKLLKIKKSLPPKYKINYLVFKSVDPDDMGIIYKMSTLVVGRAGANTINELGTLGIPSLLIPLPWSADNEQFINAKILKDMGLAEILEQQNLTPELLFLTIKKMIKDIKYYRKNDKNYKRLYYKNGVKKIVDHIYTQLNNNMISDEEN